MVSSLAEENSGTTGVRKGFELDVAALEAWMQANVADYAGPLRVEQFKGGQSNPTYKLITPTRSYVLRRKPPGKLLKGAHAVDREARVLRALGEAGFPVAKVYGLCTDESVIGSWFFVMAMVEGRIIWDYRMLDIEAADRPAYFDAMNRTIAALHAIDREAVGLGDYGRTGNYYERQIALWTRQYRADELAGRDPRMDRAIEWLSQNVPTDDETTIVHGDFRVDNMIFDADRPEIPAVLDWELSTLGHPIADFAYHASLYRVPRHIVPGLGGFDPEALNIPGEAEYVARYAERTGRDMASYDYAVAFNIFRLTAIFHGIRGRVLRGTAANEQARERSETLPELYELTWEQAMRAGAK